MSLLKLNPIEPPWYGPVCPVVWEGWHREVSPYPDLRPEGDINSLSGPPHCDGDPRSLLTIIAASQVFSR